MESGNSIVSSVFLFVYMRSTDHNAPVFDWQVIMQLNYIYITHDTIKILDISSTSQGEESLRSEKNHFVSIWIFFPVFQFWNSFEMFRINAKQQVQ